MTAQEQIDKLAKFILEEMDGEPSQNEGAIDTAIRVIRQQSSKLVEIRKLHKQIETLLRV